MKHAGIAGAALALVLVVASAATAPAGIAKVEGGIEFTYQDANAGSVTLAGDFNSWNMNATPLTKGSDGVWRVVVELAPGDYEYKFVVNGSEWIADPENPRVLGDYGNSGLTVDADGAPVIAAAVEEISNTPVNSRVMLNGWYRATYETRSDVPSDPRWRLGRPAHEFYIGVNPTVTSVASGSAMLRLSTGIGDYREMTADIYSGHATLEGGPFSVTGYYNEEVLQFDNPLETVGHIDLDFTIPEEHIPFGRGSQGIILGTEFWDFTLDAAYTNIYDYFIMNDPGIYDNTETDLIAARLKHPLGPATLGATFTSWRDGWWIDWTGTNSSPHIDEFRVENPESQSDWFELANTESWMGVDVDVPILGELLNAKAEVARYQYDSRFDMGNKEKVEGEDYSNGAIDVPIGSADGLVATGVFESSPLPTLDLRLQLTRLKVDGMDEDELYVDFGSPNWLAVWEDVYTEVKYDGSPLSVNVYGPAPLRYELDLEFDARFGFGIFDLGFEYDRACIQWEYLDVLTGHFGSFKLYKETGSRLSATAGVELTDRIILGVATEMFGLDYKPDYIDPQPDDPELKDPSSLEAIVTADVGLWADWSLLVDVRSKRYVDGIRFGTEPVGYSFITETYVAPYVALAYMPRENVELRVGYGVNPISYADTPVEGRGNGRERWLSEYLWDHGGHDLLDAEEAMEDARTIGLMAIITF